MIPPSTDIPALEVFLYGRHPLSESQEEGLGQYKGQSGEEG